MPRRVRARPELVCPVGLGSGSPLPDGHVDLSNVASKYIDSGFAVIRTVYSLSSFPVCDPAYRSPNIAAVIGCSDLARKWILVARD